MVIFLSTLYLPLMTLNGFVFVLHHPTAAQKRLLFTTHTSRRQGDAE